MCREKSLPCSAKFDVSRRALHRYRVVACRIRSVWRCFQRIPRCKLGRKSRKRETLDDALRNVAILPASLWTEAIASARVSDADERQIEAAQAGLLWRLAEKAAILQGGGSSQLFVDVDPFAPVQQEQGPAALSSGGTAAVSGSSAPAKRKLKLSSLVDHRDDPEIGGASTKQVAAWHQQYITVMGAPPQEEEEPSADQLQALYHRTVVLGNAPYVDHAVWGPFGRKTTKANKFRTWIPTSDSSYISKELPGPENFQQWLPSWRVFEVAAIMLDLSSMAALALYEKAIESSRTADTNVVSTASWTPPKMGSLFAAVVTCVRTARSMSCTHIARRGRLLFSHSRGCIVQRETPSGEHPRLRASCSVVAKAVEWTATPAGASGQGQRQRETTSEQDSEEDRLDLSEGRSNKADCTSGTRGVVSNSIWCFLLFFASNCGRTKSSWLSGHPNTLMPRSCVGTSDPFQFRASVSNNSTRFRISSQRRGALPDSFQMFVLGSDSGVFPEFHVGSVVDFGNPSSLVTM